MSGLNEVYNHSNGLAGETLSWDYTNTQKSNDFFTSKGQTYGFTSHLTGRVILAEALSFAASWSQMDTEVTACE